MASNTEDKPKAQPAPGRPTQLPALPAGVVWDTVVIGKSKSHPGFEFVYQAAESLTGIDALCKSNGKVAAGLFNRAVRIAIPARLDARKVLADAKTPEARSKALTDLQTEMLAYDLTAKPERGVRAPKTVDLTGVKLNAEQRRQVEAALAAAGVKIAESK